MRCFPHGALIVFDADLRYLSAGGLGLPEVGLSRAMLEGHTIFEVFAPAVVAVIEPLYRRALAGHESAIDVPYEGHVFLQRLGPLRDADGGIGAGMGFTQDVTTVRDAERRLQESETRFRTSFAHSPMPMALIGSDGGYHQVNPAMCAFTGYTEHELVNMTMADLAHPDDLAADADAMAGLLSGERTMYAVDKRYIRADGAIVWGTKSATAVRREDGSPLHIIAQIQDITERKQHEDSLADERRRLTDAESIGRVGSWEMDLATQAVTWSAGLLELYGLDPHEFDGNYAAALECIHPDDRALVNAGVEACAHTGEPLRSRYRVIRARDGALRWIEIRGEALYENGERVRMSGAIADITDQVEAAAAAAAAASARKLAEAAQLSADKQNQANVLKDQLLSRMSHELRTPLNAVLGFAQLLDLDELSPVQHEAVRHILDGGLHLVALVDDILDLTKIQSKAAELLTEPFPITELLAQTAALMQPLAVTGGVNLAYDPAPIGGQLVQADRRRLRQVLLNLLSNAIKFNRPGGRVDLSVLTVQTHVDIVVSDTGRGIAAADLPRLFTPFDRLSAPADGIDGTGLGLTLSRDLMVAMGGSLRATSTEGVGSTFIASVPLARPLS